MSTVRIQPGYLKKGDEVAIISPSFCVDAEKLEYAVTFLEKWGLTARIGKNAAKRNGPFAGSDEERLADLQEATDNPDIKAVLCARGGYGLLRIIDKVDFSLLKKNPKWYVGFSDITVLHLWLSEIVGMMSVHADMPLHYNDPDKSGKNFVTLKKSLFGNLEKITWNGLSFRQKDVEGEVTGGNLSLIYSLIGTQAAPQAAGKILFLEEVGEYFYHVDRMLMSMKLAGKLEGLAALVIGGMNRINNTNIPWGRSIEETVMDIVSEYDYPVFFGFPAGHADDNRAFYIGRNARLSANGKKSVLSFE